MFRCVSFINFALFALLYTSDARAQSTFRLIQNIDFPSPELDLNPSLRQPDVTEAWDVTVDSATQTALADAAPGDLLEIDFLPGTSYTVMLNRFHSTADNAYTWTGRVDGDPNASFTLSTVNDVTLASLIFGNGDVYSISYTEDGHHQGTRGRVPEGLLCGGDSHNHPAITGGLVSPLPAIGSEGTLNGFRTRADSPNALDILTAYTSAARIKAGGYSGIQAIINMNFSFANQVFADSGFADFSFANVGTVEVDYTQNTSDIGVDLDRLTFLSDGWIDIVHPIRDSVRADIVTLLVPDSDGSVVGLAWIYSTGKDATGGFNVVSTKTILTQVIFLHEVGHNMGLQHINDPANVMNPSISQPVVSFNSTQRSSVLNAAPVLANFRERGSVGPRFLTQLQNVTTSVQQGAKVPVVRKLVNIGTGLLNFSASADASWISVSPTAGTVPDWGKRETTITLTLDTTGLAAGSRSGLVTATGNSLNGSYPIWVNLTVIGGAPQNDNFINGETISGFSGVAYGTNLNATVEPAESSMAGQNSIWYKWKAHNNRAVTFSTIGSGFNTALGVYTGAPGTFQQVAFNDDFSSGVQQSQASFDVTSGTVYYVRVTGSAVETGNIQLTWMPSTPEEPVIEVAPHLILLKTSEGVKSGYVDLKITNPGTGTLNYTLSEEADWVHAFPVDGALTGPNAEKWHRLYFKTGTLAAGIYNTTVIISSSGIRNSPYELPVSLVVTNGPPPNDLFENIQPIYGRNGIVYGANVNGTMGTHPFEIQQDMRHSVWYRWTVPQDWFSTQSVTFRTAGSSFTVKLISESVDNAVVARLGTGQLSIPAGDLAVGRSFNLILSGNNPDDMGMLQLSWGDNKPANDNFVNAETVAGSAGYVYGRNTYATNETGEPGIIDGQARSQSVWYKWISVESENGSMTFDTKGSDYDTVLGVYTGSAVGTLTLVAGNNDDPAATSGESKVTINQSVGSTYYILVDGAVNETGNIQLNWSDGSNSVVRDWQIY